MKKVLITVGIIVGILLVVMVGINIYTSNHSLKNYDTPSTSLRIPDNKSNQQANTELKEQDKKITSFNVSVSEIKQYIDDFDNTLKKQGDYKTSLSTKWISTKQNVSPYYNLTIKGYYYNGKDICSISIASNANGNIVDMTFTGLGEELNSYKKAVVDDYTQLMVNMAFYLEKLTGDKELKDYLTDKLSAGVSNDNLLFNEYKKGIKFTCGKKSDGYFKLGFTLEKYASN